MTLFDCAVIYGRISPRGINSHLMDGPSCQQYWEPDPMQPFAC